MINHAPFQKAWQYQPASEIPLLLKQKQRLSVERPYKGWRVVHNIPLSMESVCKVETLLLGGAEVLVCRNRMIQPSSQGQAIDILRQAGVSILLDQEVKGPVDFVLDCAAELADKVKVTKGIVEITKTGSDIYKNLGLKVPMISVDDSRLKQLETFFGTGEGSVRALSYLTNKKLDGKAFVVFGYGKVGQGIVHFLNKISTDIVVVDVDQKALDKVRHHKLIGYNSKKDKTQIIEAIRRADVVVTVTGVKNAISNQFDKHLFDNKILANFGVDDEFGDKFASSEVLFDKQPANFALPDPTKMRYLDPIFYAHNMGIELIMSRGLKPGYYAFPQDVDEAIISQWQALHKEDISPIFV